MSWVSRRLADIPVAVDAAHIRWHQAGGPDTEDNGLALCALHHRLFDYGAFTVRGGLVLVSTRAVGNAGFQDHLMRYHGRPCRPPQHPDWKPNPDHTDWHGREVFKGKARHAG